MIEKWTLLTTGLVSGFFIGVGFTSWISYRNFTYTIISKADTGIRLEARGRLFTVQEEKSE